ncbi:hypothetical protein TSOC_011825 [Tetrabaena socialis]|uniref:Uncharacterized protein n=1 Tax=Tetrabaena socialis TaxID=47790 RepID=A0A2J7ZPM3_9CHLO|nr:hypothetical protein TSOC_011825 [Tetrabaena socialis]|eukprot:PNH02211.1 hypothetical protein TSOC_011825 [Tetrabaena socialis]
MDKTCNTRIRWLHVFTARLKAKQGPRDCQEAAAGDDAPSGAASSGSQPTTARVRLTVYCASAWPCEGNRWSASKAARASAGSHWHAAYDASRASACGASASPLAAARAPPWKVAKASRTRIVSSSLQLKSFKSQTKAWPTRDSGCGTTSIRSSLPQHASRFVKPVQSLAFASMQDSRSTSQPSGLRPARRSSRSQRGSKPPASAGATGSGSGSGSAPAVGGSASGITCLKDAHRTQCVATSTAKRHQAASASASAPGPSRSLPNVCAEVAEK